MALKTPERKLCISIAASSFELLARKMKKAISLHPGFVEIRLDYLDDPEAALQKIPSLLSRNVIVTIRKESEGGMFSGGEKRRVELLHSCLGELKPSIMDIELATIDEYPSFISELKNSNTKTILSYHSFQDTNPNELSKIMKRAPRFAYALKIATKANSFADNVKVLSLYGSEMLKQKAPIKLIAFCMGEVGVYSRIECLAKGSPLSFVSLPGEAVAPGQLDFGTMKQVLELRD